VVGSPEAETAANGKAEGGVTEKMSDGVKMLMLGVTFRHACTRWYVSIEDLKIVRKCYVCHRPKEPPRPEGKLPG